MRIPSGSTDRKIYFVAVDATDLKTRETGLSSFTVYRSRDGGAATAYTTPTVSEISAANMPGVYALTLDEDTTIAAGHDTEEYCLHITQASMAPVTRALELYRPKFTEGQSATMANSRVDALMAAASDGVLTAAKFAAGAFDAVWSVAARILTAGTNIVLAKGVGVTGFNDLDAAGVRGAVGLAAADLDTQLGGINAKTTNLPTDPADQSLVIAATDAIMSRLGVPAGASVSADVAAVKADSAAILLDTGTDGVLLTVAERAAVADKLLGRSIAGGADGGRMVKDALRTLRNKQEIAAGVLTVYAEDDLTPAFTAAVTTAAGNPINSIDPA